MAYHPQAMSLVIYTVGHSNRSFEQFLELVSRHQVDCLVDVRSTPWSRRWPWFRKPALAARLPGEGIAYRHLGALGGRPAAGEATTPESFHRAISQVLALGSTGRVAIMCAEADPARCHRSSLLAPAFVARGATVVHLLTADRVQEHVLRAEPLPPHPPPPVPVMGDLFDA